MLNSEEIQKGMFLIQWQNQKLKHIKRMVHNNWLGTGIFLCRKWWIEPGSKDSLTSYLYDNSIKFHYIDDNVLTKQTDTIAKYDKNKSTANLIKI